MQPVSLALNVTRNAEVGAYLSGELEIDFRLIRSETLDETLTSGTEKEKDAHDDL